MSKWSSICWNHDFSQRCQYTRAHSGQLLGNKRLTTGKTTFSVQYIYRTYLDTPCIQEYQRCLGNKHTAHMLWEWGIHSTTTTKLNYRPYFFFLFDVIVKVTFLLFFSGEDANRGVTYSPHTHVTGFTFRSPERSAASRVQTQSTRSSRTPD